MSQEMLGRPKYKDGVDHEDMEHVLLCMGQRRGRQLSRASILVQCFLKSYQQSLRRSVG